MWPQKQCSVSCCRKATKWKSFARKRHIGSLPSGMANGSFGWLTATAPLKRFFVRPLDGAKRLTNLRSGRSERSTVYHPSCMNLVSRIWMFHSLPAVGLFKCFLTRPSKNLAGRSPVHGPSLTTTHHVLFPKSALADSCRGEIGGAP